jgi:hypothetical protein
VALEDFVGDPDLTVGRQFEGQVNHGGLNPRIHPVLEQRPVVRYLLQCGFAASIVQFLEPVEAVARVAHHAAGLTDVSELPGQLDKYLNNIVEQDHRAIKRITKPMLGFKDFRCARIILSGIEVMHMIRKGQMQVKKDTHPSAAGQFYSLVM